MRVKLEEAKTSLLALILLQLSSFDINFSISVFDPGSIQMAQCNQQKEHRFAVSTMNKKRLIQRLITVSEPGTFVLTLWFKGHGCKELHVPISILD